MPAGFDPLTGLQPAQQTYYTADTQGNTTQTGTNTGAQANTYTPGQLALQGQLPATLQGLITGQSQVPAYMTAPPIVFQAFNNAYDAYVKPGMVRQFGAGSPQVYGQQAMSNEQLAANLYRGGVQDYMGFLGMANANAFTPTGATTTHNTNQNWQSDTEVNGYQGDSILGSILSKLMGLL